MSSTVHAKLSAKYRKLEAEAEALSCSRYASAEDKREAWARANAVWEQLVALKRKRKVSK